MVTLRLLWIISSLLSAIAVFESIGAQSRPTTGKPSHYPTTQAERMVGSERRIEPDFLSEQSRNKPSVKFRALCPASRNPASSTPFSNSTSECSPPASGSSSGASPNEYFGGAQRQTGFGITVGK